MPIVNKSIVEKSKEKTRTTLTLQKDQRMELKELMTEWNQLEKEMTRPIEINENLSIQSWVEDMDFFYYKDPKKEDNLDYPYSYFGLSRMLKKSKKQKLSNIEEILFATWNELNDTGSWYSMFEPVIDIEPIKSELKRRSNLHREWQVKLEKFFFDMSPEVLKIIKKQENYELGDLFKFLIKGNTIEAW